MKNKELDLLIVVNMFLTGFYATTLNTLWVDKNLKMHGFIQAFSRINRILNSIILPPVSGFGGGRDQKKQRVIEKLKVFFEKYYGIGSSASFTDNNKNVVYEIPENSNLMMVAEPESSYGKI